MSQRHATAVAVPGMPTAVPYRPEFEDDPELAQAWAPLMAEFEDCQDPILCNGICKCEKGGRDDSAKA